MVDLYEKKFKELDLKEKRINKYSLEKILSNQEKKIKEKCSYKNSKENPPKVLSSRKKSWQTTKSSKEVLPEHHNPKQEFKSLSPRIRRPFSRELSKKSKRENDSLSTPSVHQSQCKTQRKGFQKKRSLSFKSFPDNNSYLSGLRKKLSRRLSKHDKLGKFLNRGLSKKKEKKGRYNFLSATEEPIYLDKNKLKVSPGRKSNRKSFSPQAKKENYLTNSEITNREKKLRNAMTSIKKKQSMNNSTKKKFENSTKKNMNRFITPKETLKKNKLSKNKLLLKTIIEAAKYSSSRKSTLNRKGSKKSLASPKRKFEKSWGKKNKRGFLSTRKDIGNEQVKSTKVFDVLQTRKDQDKKNFGDHYADQFKKNLKRENIAKRKNLKSRFKIKKKKKVNVVEKKYSKLEAIKKDLKERVKGSHSKTKSSFLRIQENKLKMIF